MFLTGKDCTYNPYSDDTVRLGDISNPCTVGDLQKGLEFLYLQLVVGDSLVSLLRFLSCILQCC